MAGKALVGNPYQRLQTVWINQKRIFRLQGIPPNWIDAALQRYLANGTPFPWNRTKLVPIGRIGWPVSSGPYGQLSVGRLRLPSPALPARKHGRAVLPPGWDTAAHSGETASQPCIAGLAEYAPGIITNTPEPVEFRRPFGLAESLPTAGYFVAHSGELEDHRVSGLSA